MQAQSIMYLNKTHQHHYTNWVNQWYTLMDWFRNKKFFKVNEQLDDKPTNRKIGEWDLWRKILI